MTPQYPDALRVVLVGDVTDAISLCRLLIDETDGPPWPAITAFGLGNTEAGKQGGKDALLGALDKPAAARTDRIHWKLGPAVAVSVIPGDNRVDVTLMIYDAKRDRCTAWLRAIEGLLNRLLGRGLPIWHAHVARFGGGVDCIPTLKVIGGATYIVITHDDTLGATFEHPDDAIAAAGWEDKRVGDHRVLTRAFGAESNVEMLSEIQDGQWAMVRAAQPGMVSYGDGEPAPEEHAIFHAGDRRVLAVGYDPDERAAIFSCATEPDQHIHPWEIYSIKDMIEAGKLPSGKELAELRVVFPDQATMHREKRPLLDVGAAVRYYDERGELVPFTEAE